VNERARLATAVTIATAGLVVALGVGPVSTGTIVAAYVLILAAIGVGALTRALQGAPDLRVSPFEHALAHERHPQTRPPELVRVEREITLAMSNAGHLHRRLVPILRDVASARLGGRLTRERVGDDATWELVRPDRPEPQDAHAPGASLEQIRRAVERLEAL
jgi:hypothetical protein